MPRTRHELNVCGKVHYVPATMGRSREYWRLRAIKIPPADYLYDEINEGVEYAIKTVSRGSNDGA